MQQQHTSCVYMLTPPVFKDKRALYILKWKGRPWGGGVSYIYIYIQTHVSTVSTRHARAASHGSAMLLNVSASYRQLLAEDLHVRLHGLHCPGVLQVPGRALPKDGPEVCGHPQRTRCPHQGPRQNRGREGVEEKTEGGGVRDVQRIRQEGGRLDRERFANLRCRGRAGRRLWPSWAHMSSSSTARLCHGRIS